MTDTYQIDDLCRTLTKYIECADRLVTGYNLLDVDQAQEWADTLTQIRSLMKELN